MHAQMSNTCRGNRGRNIWQPWEKLCNNVNIRWTCTAFVIHRIKIHCLLSCNLPELPDHTCKNPCGKADKQPSCQQLPQQRLVLSWARSKQSSGWVKPNSVADRFAFCLVVQQTPSDGLRRNAIPTWDERRNCCQALLLTQKHLLDTQMVLIWWNV